MTDEEDVTERRWSGYSDYKEVASQLHKDINSAVEAYSHVDSKSAQNIGVTPQTAVRTRTEILRVAKRLHVEIERNQSIDGFPEIHEDWRGDDGYLNRLEDAGLVDTTMAYHSEGHHRKQYFAELNEFRLSFEEGDVAVEATAV